jgi:hypothetical protein
MSYWVQKPSKIAPKIDENTKQEVDPDFNDPDFNAWLSQKQKENRAENARLNASVNGRPGARVLCKGKNGKMVVRDPDGREKREQKNAEGDAKETGEQKRRDDANRAAANKANKAAQAAQDRQDNADWGGRGTQNPYYVDLGIYM